MNQQIDIKTLEALRSGDHKAFETVFISYYNRTRNFIFGYIKSESDAEELTEDLGLLIDRVVALSTFLDTGQVKNNMNYLSGRLL